MTDEQKLEQFLSEQQFMVIAVVLDDGSPWAVPVRIQAHNGNKFEWDSAQATEHSRVIAKGNAKVAVMIYQKTDDFHFGFYAKGRAELVAEFKPGFGRYKFTAEKCWINDETFVKREVRLG